jgi:transposase
MGSREIATNKHIVRLAEREREQLEALVHADGGSARRLLKAWILLKADIADGGEGWSDAQIVEGLKASASTVYRVRKQLAEHGLAAALSRKPVARSPVPKIFDADKEARLIALATSTPPDGRPRWTLRMLEQKVVELNIVDRASDSTIGRTLSRAAPTVRGPPSEL